MLLFVLSASCLAQFPLDILPPPPSRPQQLPMQSGAPVRTTKAAVVSIGEDYLVAWRDGRRKTPDSPSTTSIFLRSARSGAVTSGSTIEVPGSIGQAGVPDLHLASSRQFALLVAAVTTGGTTQLRAWKLGTGRWDGGVEAPFVIANDIRPSLTAAAGNETEVQVTWWSAPGSVMGQRFPLATPPSVLTSVAQITNLTMGSSDGGFIVAWSQPTDAITVLREGVASLLTSASSVQAVTSATEELVVTQNASNATIHRWQNAWTQLPFPVPFPSPLLVASTPQTLFAATTTAGGLSAQVWNVADGGQAAFMLGMGTPMALGGRRDDDKALLAFNSMQALHLTELSLATGFFNPVSATTPLPLTGFLAQQSPTVVWFDPLSAFVLMWDEELPNGTMQLRASVVSAHGSAQAAQSLGAGQLGGFRPQLLRGPSGTRFALARSVSSSRQVFEFGLDGGLLTWGAALTNPANLPNAVLGQQVAAQWTGGNSTVVIADQEASPRFTRAVAGPRCAAVTNGGLWFVTTTGLLSTPDQPMMSPPLPSESALSAPLPLACAAASVNDSTLLYVVSRTDGGAQVSTVRASTNGVALVTPIAPIPAPVVVPPVLAAIDGGVVVAWAEPTGVKVAFAAEPATFIKPDPLGGSDVATVSIAASPQGDVLVAWDSFEPEVQTRRVQYRYLLVPGSGRVDAGVDAGTIDGGSIDGGSIDGGSIDGGSIDGGSIDGGSIDGGSIDGGSIDGGSIDGGSIDGGSIDGGSIDAGSIDAGSIDGGSIDAGVVDAGLMMVDAGATDAGSTAVDSGVLFDGGTVELVTFVPVCGCTSIDTSTLLGALALVLLARRRVHV